MTEQILITIEKRRHAALIDALQLARYALLRSGRRFDAPPFDGYSVAAKIDAAIANATPAGQEVRS